MSLDIGYCESQVITGYSNSMPWLQSYRGGSNREVRRGAAAAPPVKILPPRCAPHEVYDNEITTNCGSTSLAI